MRVYIASPYSALTEEQCLHNVRRSIRAWILLWKKGHSPFCPLTSHFIDAVAKEDGISISWDEWMEWCLDWVGQCDALLYLGPSKGADIELARAISLRKRIFVDIEDVPPAPVDWEKE